MISTIRTITTTIPQHHHNIVKLFEIYLIFFELYKFTFDVLIVPVNTIKCFKLTN